MARQAASIVLVLAALLRWADGSAAVSVELTTLHTFTPGILGDGPSNPTGGLVQAADGNFYGTTALGGAHGGGAIYKLTPSGAFSVLYSFASGSDPRGSLIQAADGNLYGTTHGGGANGKGTLYRVSPAGAYSLIHSFGATAADAARPMWGLAVGPDGALYGTAVAGAEFSGGAVFRTTTGGAYSIVHAFGTYAYDERGAEPSGPLTLASDGKLYGLSKRGGRNGFGLLYSITPSGTFAVVYEFARCFADGLAPVGRPVEGPDGAFYGSAGGGGSVRDWDGTLFAISKSGASSILHRYPDGFPSVFAEHGVLGATDGNFYGVTLKGGANHAEDGGDGTIFMVSPAGEYATIYEFADGDDGAFPHGELIQGNDGRLYGVNAFAVYALSVSGTAAGEYPADRGAACTIDAGALRVELLLAFLLAGLLRRPFRTR